MRTIIYGDIHGCLEEFKLLRAELKITAEDREISVGDVLDRGPHSFEMVPYLQKNNIELVMGNHEYTYVRYKKHEFTSKETGKKNPMTINEEKMSVYKKLSQEDMNYLEQAPFFLKIDNTTILHAGITNKINLENATKKELELLTRIREVDKNENMMHLGKSEYGSNFWSEVYDGSQGVIVYGHNIFSKPKIDKYSFGIDTGCVYGGKLTALIVYDTRDPMFNYDIVQVSACKEYVVNNKMRIWND